MHRLMSWSPLVEPRWNIVFVCSSHSESDSAARFSDGLVRIRYKAISIGDQQNDDSRL